ncbi:MAG TPA: methyltransferase [Pyrinomonadaceae bacterium]|jgi:ubiquinone/menaquinone biosynthesis C-methylase UbiE
MSTHPQPTITAIPLMQIVAGFWASKTLASAVELDLFTKLSGKGVNIEELAALLDMHPRPAEMLLSGCASLGLLEKRGDRFYNSQLSEEFLVRGKPYYFGGVVTMLDRRLYLPWNRLTAALKTNRAQTWGDEQGLFEAISKDPEEQRIFTEAMHSFSNQSGKAVAESFDFSPYKKLLDVGGGSGAYCIEAARRYPHLRAVVFDIPAALEIAREKIAEAGLSDRIETYSGDFFNEELPKGSDVILLSMILHDWTPEKNRAILRRCFAALPSGGALIVSELMMDDDKAGPVPAALMSLNMLIETEGRNYTWSEYTGWMEEAGLTEIKRVAVLSPGANGLLIGHKP